MEQNIKTVIGQRIKELRALRGMTQRDLAEATGINNSNIAQIELGKVSVGIDVLERIAQALGSTVALV